MKFNYFNHLDYFLSNLSDDNFIYEIIQFIEKMVLSEGILSSWKLRVVYLLMEGAYVVKNL